VDSLGRVLCLLVYVDRRILQAFSKKHDVARTNATLHHELARTCTGREYTHCACAFALDLPEHISAQYVLIFLCHMCYTIHAISDSF
jgi:hypothetical protein